MTGEDRTSTRSTLTAENTVEYIEVKIFPERTLHNGRCFHTPAGGKIAYASSHVERS